MPESIHGTIGTVFLVGALSIGGLVVHTSLLMEHNALAGAPPAIATEKQPEAADRGRAIFNGKGVCYYCHGVDGYLDQRPQLEADTAAFIAGLNPQPSNLRNPKALHLKSDKQRRRAIREGHPGTGMFPDRTIADQEVADTLAYLALLRSESSAKRK